MMLINASHEAMRLGKARNIMTGLFQELEKYAQIHFKNEEELMVKNEYPEVEDHQIEHRKFIQKIGTFYQLYKKQQINSTMPIMSFLTDWVSSHIIRIDKKYSQFFNEKGVF
ncbi:hemerythrin family protein [candidate division KSB1 bacterium]|nr:hemerythrin family protein [candidate division KSB1 bacterium]